MKLNQALISVSDKTGVVEFAQELSNLGTKIVSTGGTAKALRDAELSVKTVEDITGFPEILEGRVKTLHPKIFGAILARKEIKEHTQQLEKHQIEPIDIVIVNLYPFEATISKQREYKITDEIIENIDIGGVTLLRAAAKNYQDVLIVCEPSDYQVVLEKIKSNTVTPEFRLELAAKAFRHTAYYDALISSYLTQEQFPEKIVVGMKKVVGLRYGENPHQKASLYETPNPKLPIPNLIKAQQLQGKEMSYNNYLDVEAALSIVQEFANPACVIIKHNNPCGVGEARTLTEAYQKAFLCDQVSAFGGIIAFNSVVDETTAKAIGKLFAECIIAPGFDQKAKEIFVQKKDLRLLELPALKPSNPFPEMYDFRLISGAMLVQDKDVHLGLTDIKSVTQRQPTTEELDGLKFAWRIAKWVKSNAIVLVRGTQSVGVGAGQMSRIDSVKIAVSKMQSIDQKLLPKSSLVLASDAFFPFPDVVEEGAKYGVTAIIQPGGSLKDQDSINACNKLNIAMVFTGMRHFRH